MLKMTGVKLSFISDIDKYQFIEIRYRKKRSRHKMSS